MKLRKTIIKCLLVTGMIFSILSNSFAQTNNIKVQDMSMEQLIDSLAKATGEEYIEKEAQLRQGGATSISALKEKLNDNDSFTRIYANTMIEWIEGRSPNNNTAINHLDNLPEKISRTPRLSPSPMGTADYLSLHFQESVTKILAIHLIKLPDLPYWRTAAILLYLEQQKPQEITDILLRFITETSDDDFRDTALSTIDVINDPHLKSKILEEQARLKSLGLSLPQSLKKRLSEP